jgi:hypothetical protein
MPAHLNVTEFALYEYGIGANGARSCGSLRSPYPAFGQRTR